VTQVGAQEAIVDSAAAEATLPSVSTKQVASSAIWRATETAGTELVAFVVFTTLARLLAPEDFGAVALAGSIMTMLQGLLYHGFTEALIQKPDVGEAHHRTVLATNLLFATALIVLGFLLAWPLGLLLGRGEFPTIFGALLPSLLLRGLSSPMLASLRRDLDFRAIALRTLLGVCVGGALAVMLARHGAGYWALVVQQWSAELVGFLVLIRASPTKPWRLHFDRAVLRELLPVALPVMGAAFLSVAARRLDTVALGIFLPNAVVGIYFMVYRLVFAAQMVTQHGLSEVAMVVLSSISQDRERYRRGVLRALRLMSYVCACAFGLLSAAGPWLVPLVFGSRWQDATEPLRVLAALSLGGAVVSIAGVTLVASGYAAAFSRLSVGAAVAQLIAVAVAARWGLMAVVWSVGIAQCLAIIPALRMLSRHYDVSWRDLVSELAPIVLFFVAGLLAAQWTSTLGTAWYMQPVASLVFCAVMAVAAWPLVRRERAERRANAAEQSARHAQSTADAPAETPLAT